MNHPDFDVHSPSRILCVQFPSFPISQDTLRRFKVSSQPRGGDGDQMTSKPLPLFHGCGSAFDDSEVSFKFTHFPSWMSVWLLNHVHLLSSSKVVFTTAATPVSYWKKHCHARHSSQQYRTLSVKRGFDMNDCHSSRLGLLDI